MKTPYFVYLRNRLDGESRIVGTHSYLPSEHIEESVPSRKPLPASPISYRYIRLSASRGWRRSN